MVGVSLEDVFAMLVKIDKRSEQIEQRLEQVELRLDEMGQRFDWIEEQSKRTEEMYATLIKLVGQNNAQLEKTSGHLETSVKKLQEDNRHVRKTMWRHDREIFALSHHLHLDLDGLMEENQDAVK